MAGPNPVAINIVVNAGSAQEAIAKMRAEIARLDGAGNAAGKGAAAASGGIKELKEQMGRGRETAMFFTQALGEFGPQGRTAQIAISGIVGGILGGGGLLLALSLAQAGVRLLVEAWKEEEEAAKKAAKEREEAAAKADEAARRSLGVINDGTETYRQTNQRLRAEISGVTKEEQAHREEMSRLRAEMVLLEGAQLKTAQRRLSEIERLHAENKALEAQVKVREDLRKRAEKEAEAKARTPLGPAFTADAQRIAAAIAEADKRIAANRNSRRMAQGAGPVGITGLTPEELRAELMAIEAMDRSLGQVGSVLQSAGSAMAADFVGAFRPMLTQTASFRAAMRAAGGAVEDTADLSGAAFAAMAQNALASLAIESAQRAIFETAYGIAAAATGNPAAAGHFAAAALFAGVAGAAGGVAGHIGANRGMTSAEQAQVKAQQEATDKANAGGSGGGSFSSGTTGGTTTIRETVLVIGHPYMTRAEVAQVAARTIEDARRLDMLRREG